MEEKIDKSNVEDILEMPGNQQGMLFHYLKDTTSISYNSQIWVDVEGPFDHDLMQQAIKQVQQNNEVLRSVFRWKGLKKPLQIVLKQVDFEYQYFDLADQDKEEQEAKIKSVQEKYWYDRFDLTKLPVKLFVVRKSDHSFLLSITHHHILYDGWSSSIFVNEILQCYGRLYHGKAPQFDKPSYKEFYQALKKKEQSDELEQYWSSYLSGYSKRSSVYPKKLLSTEAHAGEPNRQQFVTSAKETAGLNRLSQRMHVTVSNILQSAWAVLLSKYNYGDDVVFGTVFSGRPTEFKGVEKMIGMCVNTLPVRIAFDDEHTFGDLFQNTKEKSLESESYQYSSLADVQEHTELGGDLLDHIFVFQNYPVNKEIAIANEETRFFIKDFGFNALPNYDLAVVVVPDEHYTINFFYNPECYPSATIERVKGHFQHLISYLVEQEKVENTPVIDFDLLGVKDKRELSTTDSSEDKIASESLTFLDLFRERVAKAPNEVAVKDPKSLLTYQELNHRSDALAEQLNASTSRASVALIRMEPSVDLMVAVLGAMKSGKAFIPLDPEQFSSRQNSILEKFREGVLLTSKPLANEVSFAGATLFLEDIPGTPTKKFTYQVGQDDLAYIIFTSGTSGNPKGVQITHGNLVNYSTWLIDFLGLGQQDASLLTSSFAFDLGYTSVFPVLASGGQLNLISRSTYQSPDELLDYIQIHQITFLKLTPSLFSTVVDAPSFAKKDFSHLKHILLGGESIHTDDINTFRNTYAHVQFVNHYGPSETTIGVIAQKITNYDEFAQQPTIGQPIANTRAFILDQKGRLAPYGAVGELCISGASVGKGYVDLEALTNEKFVSHEDIPGGKLYRTGDLARWLPNGMIEFLGRADNQVKVRGYRVELRDVEAHIQSHGSVSKAVVITNGEETGKFLVGYYVPSGEVTTDQLKAHLEEELPDYMVPTFMVPLEKLPLTRNNKLDITQLPEPEMEGGVTEEIELSPVQQKLRTVWANILKIEEDKIGLHSSFFELGGHSLKAIALANNLNKHFEIKVSLNALFDHPTLEQMSVYIEQLDHKEHAGIKPAKTKPFYPLSSAQKRMYFLYETDRSAVAYNMPFIARLSGQVDIDRLNGAFRKLIQRHESLRTYFDLEEGQVVQKINAAPEFQINYRTSEESPEELIEQFVQPFDLGVAPLIRVDLVASSSEEHLMMVDLHHIITDGTSRGIMVQDLMALYEDKAPLPALKLQYKDYAVWQQANEQQHQLTKQREFWRKEFAEETEVLDLPTDFKRPKIRDHKGLTEKLTLNTEQSARLRAMAKEEDVTVFMLLLSVFNVFLSKLSNNEDIVVGSPVVGREHSDLAQVAGLFVNSLALRNYPKSDRRFVDFLKDVKQRTLQSFEHQALQFEDLVDELKLERSTNRHPLFDVMFVFQNFDADQLRIPGLTLTPYEENHRSSRFDLVLIVNEFDETIDIDFQYATELFRSTTMHRFMAYFEQVVNEVLRDSSRKIGDLNMLSEKESSALLQAGQAYEDDEMLQHSIVALFEKQVMETPDLRALAGSGIKMTYEQLNQKANQLAHELIDRGVKEQMVIALLFDRSPEMIISILAILKVGAIYLPITPSSPDERINFILDDSHSQLMLVQNGSLDRDYQVSTIHYDSLGLDGRAIDNPSRSVAVTPDALAYIIYTSGTTGKPKGTPIRHSSVSGLVKGSNYLQIVPEDNVLQLANYAFDISVFDIFGALLNGASLVLVEGFEVKDIARLSTYIREQEVTIFVLTASMFNLLVDESLDNLKSTRTILFGGESASVKHVNKAFEYLGAGRLINAYGPTEAAVYATYYAIDQLHDEQRALPIGKPISHSHIYVLDEHQNLVPGGVPGELCIGGPRLSPGYLNREELTKEKFVPNPFAEGERLYRTGDLARWIPDGLLEFLGRMDDQVKLRGYRIELDEIEHLLNGVAQVKESFVTVLDEADQYMVAYYISDEVLDASSLKYQLSRELPPYMIPSYFVHLTKLPLTANGKVDRKSLPSPTMGATGVYESPASVLEERLQALWSDLLNVSVEELSVTGNFFEYGGHSLKAVLLVNKIKEAFNLKISVQNIFEYQSIRSLGRYMKSLDEFAYEGITKAPLKEFYKVSSAQQRMYFLSEFEEESLANNMFESVRIEGVLDEARLNSAFADLVFRHESLRTYFDVVEGEIVQFISSDIDFNITRLEATPQQATQVVRDFITPFNLSEAPLIRIGLVRLSDTDHILVINMHHIISDGLSVNLLIKDFLLRYAGSELPAPKLQYKDFAEWQRLPERAEELEDQRTFWLDTFKTQPDALDLPLDFKRPAIRNNDGDFVETTLNTTQVEKLQALARAQEATPYITLLTLFNVLLSKLSNQEDLVVGTPVAGRPHADTESVVGLFMNTLAMRNQVSGQLSFTELLSQIKATALQCFDHQHYHFEDLIDDLNVKRDTSRNPLFDVMFSYQNGEDATLTIPNLEVSAYEHGYTPSKFDLTLTATVFSADIVLRVTYNNGLFTSETIRRFLDYYINLVDLALADPNIRVADMDMLAPIERDTLLEAFNRTEATYPADQTLVSLIETQVQQKGEAVALHVEGQDYSYAYLDQRSNQIARYLMSQGTTDETMVGVLLDRNADMIISMLGVLKAGCAYVPIDPMYPLDRVKYMIEDSGLPLILSSKAQASITAQLDAVEVLDVQADAIDDLSAEKIGKAISPQSLCYVIYTSGSTGRPKGIMIEHQAVVNFIFGVLDRINLKEVRSMLSLTTVSFDIFVLENWLPLSMGSRVVMANTEEQLDIEALSRLINSAGVEGMQLTPSRLDLLLQVSAKDLLADVQVLMIGGEAFPQATFDSLRKQYHGRVYNMYGPTETTVWSTIQDLTGRETIDLGKPINNTQTYILDKHLTLQPMGVSGELYIGGDGLARGYLNNEKLTEERFVESPFEEGKRLYKTGDIARYLPDGSLEFMGRGDHQVKIRGYRIELGEIEAQILGVANIEQAVVMAWHEGSQKSLVAYYTAGTVIESFDLRNHLAGSLPEYMIPTHYMQLDQMPLTPNGKIDRRSLPEPELQEDKEHVAPVNEVEETLVDVWSEVLEVERDRISVTRSFFELGGNSLKSVLLISRINKELQIELKVRDLFTKQNIRNIAELIEINNWLFASEADEEESVEFTL